MRVGPVVLFSGLLLCAGAAVAQNLPADVAAFVADREQCDHFRGEEPYDAERGREIDAALDRYCRGTDARLAALKKKYAKGPASVSKMLAGFEDRIE